MRLLNRTQSRFRHWFTTEGGMRFRGTIQPLKGQQASSTTFLEPRHALYTGFAEPLAIGTVVFDPLGRPFLAAEHDIYDGLLKINRLFRLEKKASWKRSLTSTEPITGLAKAGSEQELGPVWIASEIYGREEVDRGTHMGMDRQRIVTGAAIQLSDKIDGLMVRRIATVYGVTVAEIQ